MILLLNIFGLVFLIFASTLYKFAKEEKYPIFDLPIVAIPLDVLPFKVSDFDEFIYQCRRVQDCSLEYSILLDDKGIICDGYHRVVKAILEGRTTIKAIRLQKMPKYDELIEE